jgi:FixJ family two-component response regulator
MNYIDSSLPWIAVVENDEPTRRAFLRLLRAAGLVARGFSGGAEFLAASMEQPPYCVVLDMQMPLMDGIELQRRLAGRIPRCAIIAVSGSPGVATRNSIERAGALAFLPKPVEQVELLAAIASAWVLWTEDM